MLQRCPEKEILYSNPWVASLLWGRIVMLVCLAVWRQMSPGLLPLKSPSRGKTMGLESGAAEDSCAFDSWNPSQAEIVYRVVDHLKGVVKKRDLLHFLKREMVPKGLTLASRGSDSWLSNMIHIPMGSWRDQGFDLLLDPLPSYTFLPEFGSLDSLNSFQFQELCRTLRRSCKNSSGRGKPWRVDFHQFECEINGWFKKGTWFLWAYFVLELFCKGWEVYKNKHTPLLSLMKLLFWQRKTPGPFVLGCGFEGLPCGEFLLHASD